MRILENWWIQHLDVQALFQSSVRVYGRKSLAETWQPSSKGYILHRGMLHRKNFSIMTDWGVRIIQHPEARISERVSRKDIQPSEARIGWNKSCGPRTKDSIFGWMTWPLMIFYQNHQRHQEKASSKNFRPLVSTRVKGCWKRLTHFKYIPVSKKSLQSESIAGQGIRVGRGHSSSRPLPSPPHHYNTLLHIIRRHIIIHHELHRSEGYAGRYHS